MLGPPPSMLGLPPSMSGPSLVFLPGPPHYSMAISTTPCAPALPTDQRPSTLQAIGHFLEAMPTQIWNDLTAWSKIEPESDEEGGIPMMQNQLVCPLRPCPSQFHYLQTKGEGAMQQQSKFPVAFIDPSCRF